MDHLKENVKKMKNVYASPVRSIFDKFSKNKDVTFIYGEPIIHGKQCIVPVAKLRYSFGAGGGGGDETSTDDKTAHGQGEGGGGHFSVRPLGVYKMTGDHIQFKPAIDLKFILTLFSVLTLGVTWLLRKK
jgi:uncharacterized spore protein YtfJ